MVFGHGIPKLTQHAATGSQDIALVRGVKALEKLPVLANQCAFERRGSGVNAQINRAAIRCQIPTGYSVFGVALVELSVIVLIGKERGQTHDLAALDIAQIAQALFHLAQGEDLFILAACDGGASCHEEMAILRLDGCLRRKAQRFHEARLEL